MAADELLLEEELRAKVSNQGNGTLRFSGETVNKEPLNLDIALGVDPLHVLLLAFLEAKAMLSWGNEHFCNHTVKAVISEQDMRNRISLCSPVMCSDIYQGNLQ
jgi:hypothetical protein